MKKHMRLTIKDMELIKALLDSEYDKAVKLDASLSKRCDLIIPAVKISAMIESEKARLS